MKAFSTPYFSLIIITNYSPNNSGSLRGETKKLGDYATVLECSCYTGMIFQIYDDVPCIIKNYAQYEHSFAIKYNISPGKHRFISKFSKYKVYKSTPVIQDLATQRQNNFELFYYLLLSDRCSRRYQEKTWKLHFHMTSKNPDVMQAISIGLAFTSLLPAHMEQEVLQTKYRT